MKGTEFVRECTICDSEITDDNENICGGCLGDYALYRPKPKRKPVAGTEVNDYDDTCAAPTLQRALLAVA